MALASAPTNGRPTRGHCLSDACSDAEREGSSATPMKMKLILDLARLRVSPVTARRDHHGRRPEHEFQVPPGDPPAHGRPRRSGPGRWRDRARACGSPRKVATGREHCRPPGIGRLGRLAYCVIDERVEACTVERHAHRAEHLARALGEGAQRCMRAIIGVPKRRVDEARELRPIRLQADLPRHGRRLAKVPAGPRRRSWRRTVALFPRDRVLYSREDPARSKSQVSLTGPGPEVSGRAARDRRRGQRQRTRASASPSGCRLSHARDRSAGRLR